MYHTDILILGGGIGGYETFRTLNRLLRRHSLPQRITLVDQNNYFSFVPMHHEVASGSIEPVHCTIPLREFTHGTAHQFIKAKVKKINPIKKQVLTSEGMISYQFCVVSLGSSVNYCGIPGAAEYTRTVRHLKDAIRLQETIIKELEEPKKEFEMIIIGGGPTGVELAGQMSYFAGRDVKKLYPEKTVRISLAHGDDNILCGLSKKIRSAAEQRLLYYGVKIHSNRIVRQVREHTVEFTDGTELRGDVIIWATGFKAHADEFLPASYCERGRIPVSGHLNHKDEPTLYAIGDIALAFNPNAERPYPQLGEVAHAEGKYVAKHIIATLRRKKNPRFIFKSSGMLMPVGDWFGIGEIGPVVFTGLFAWWLRRLVYIFFMPRFGRKLRIFIDWTLHRLSTRYVVDL